MSSITIFEVRPHSKNHFIDWQAKCNAEICAYDGFISLEITSYPDQDKWIIVQRFDEQKNADLWFGSNEYQKLKRELESIAAIKELADPVAKPVTELIVTEISPQMQEAYRAWCTKIHQLEAQFPGFRGVYVQSPKTCQGRTWITLLQFDSAENLDAWLKSSERKALLQESESMITSLESHRVISPFAGWFAPFAPSMPPVWKQSMVVLLVLFPIVMLEILYLNPLTEFLGLSVSTFIANTISVCLLSFPALPFAMWALGPWLTSSNNIWGTILVLALYAAEIALFY